MKYRLIVDDGNKEGSKITIEKDGKKWKSRNGDDGSDDVALEYQHDYLFSFSKPGYVTKKIFISTKVPKSALKDGFDPYAFDITIFKQYEGVNIVMFNQPVAKIVYRPEEDNLGYDTDYTSSVLAGMQDAEKELKKKNKEAKENPVQAATSQANTAQQTTSQSEDLHNKGTESGSGSEGIRKNTFEGNGPGGSEGIKKSGTEGGGTPLKAATESDSRPGITAATNFEGRENGASVKTGSEVRERATGNNLPDNRDEKQYTEGNKRITEVTITRKGKVFVYKKVVYIWGVYFFRDNTSITESTYIQEAL